MYGLPVDGMKSSKDVVQVPRGTYSGRASESTPSSADATGPQELNTSKRINAVGMPNLPLFFVVREITHGDATRHVNDHLE
jgi:hypothetical protein